MLCVCNKHSKIPHLVLCPRAVGKLVGFLKAVSHDDVVKDGASLDLPQLKPNVFAVGVDVEVWVGLVVGVVNVGCLPDALVVGVVHHLLLPLALVLRVGKGGGLPLAILFVIPIVGLGSLVIHNRCGDVIPTLGLLVLWVGDLLALVPLLGLLGLGVLSL